MIHELVRALVTATGAECSRRELGCVHQDVLSAIFRTLYYSHVILSKWHIDF